MPECLPVVHREEQIAMLPVMKDSTVKQAGISWRIFSVWKSTQKEWYPEILYLKGGTACEPGEKYEKGLTERNSYILKTAFSTPFPSAAKGRDSSQKYHVEKETSWAWGRQMYGRGEIFIDLFSFFGGWWGVGVWFLGFLEVFFFMFCSWIYFGNKCNYIFPSQVSLPMTIMGNQSHLI